MFNPLVNKLSDAIAWMVRQLNFILSFLMNTPECIESKGKQFIARDCNSKAYLRRVNSLSVMLCNIESRTDIAESIIRRNCFIDYPEIEIESSSSSSDCPLGCGPTNNDNILYEIDVTDLDEEMNLLILEAEEELCATYKNLKQLEFFAGPCKDYPIDSSSSSSSSSTSSSSSSSSSSYSSSSSSSFSSSSSSTDSPCIENDVFFASYCPIYGYPNVPQQDSFWGPVQLFLTESEDGCIWQGTVELPDFGVSSSSSENAPHIITVSYVANGGYWNVNSSINGDMCYMFSSNSKNPGGSYAYNSPACNNAGSAQILIGS